METMVSRAIELHKKGDLEKALELYSKAINENDPSLSAFLNASSILRGNEQQKEAIKVLKKGLKIYPKEPGLWNNLGNSYMDEGDTFLAISAFRNSLTIDPKLKDPLMSLALCLREVGCQHLSYALIRDRFIKSDKNDERTSLLLPLVESVLAIYSSQKNTIKHETMTNLLKNVELEVKNSIDNNDPCKADLIMAKYGCKSTISIMHLIAEISYTRT